MFDTNAVLRFIADDDKESFVLEENVIRYGCNIYASTRLDFIDCLLIGYANVKDYQIFTFDVELKKKLGNKVYALND